MAEQLLQCRIAPGQLMGEFAVSGTLSDGTEFSMFARENDVEFEGVPSEEFPIDGWIRVSVRERQGKLVLVQLPGQALENGRFVTVNDDQVKAGHQRERV